jgi:hypothetical protein
MKAQWPFWARIVVELQPGRAQVWATYIVLQFDAEAVQLAQYINTCLAVQLVIYSASASVPLEDMSLRKAHAIG